MQKDRSIRRLNALEKSSSTARVLNLRAVHRKNPDDPTVISAPFFKNRILNHSFLLKHRLRPNEYEYFESPRPTVTKILIPIDGSDLRVGAHSLMVGQKDFDQVAEAVFGDDLKPGSWDRKTLELIDGLPSLDPFLLRDQLHAHDVDPARAYFSISDADIERMIEFVREEIMALVKLSAGKGSSSHAYATRLVEKLLSSSPDSAFEPLKDTLKLTDREYTDGVYSWRGFLYYKWVLDDLTASMTEVVAEIATVRGRGPSNAAATAYIPGAQQRIARKIRDIQANVGRMIGAYTSAYDALTSEGKPAAFREFLLDAPSMFTELGEQLGALQHIMSFWRFRFPKGKPAQVSPEDLMDILSDFEDSLALASDHPAELADA
jgi:hypothetical protein